MARKRKKKSKWQRALNATKKGLQFSLKWRYLVWAIVCVLAVLAITNYITVAYWFGHLNWVLIKDYLAIIIAMPVALLVLGLVFMHKFTDSIGEFLKKIDRLKAPGGFEVSQQQSTTPPVPNADTDQKAVEDLESKVDDGSVTLTKQEAEQYIALIETMDFRFLNLHLVQNTKDALRLMTRTEVPKAAFLQVYQVPQQVIDQVGERQAILNALSEAGLMYEDNNVLKVTDKGMRFLAFIGMSVRQPRP